MGGTGVRRVTVTATAVAFGQARARQCGTKRENHQRTRYAVSQEHHFNLVNNGMAQGKGPLFFGRSFIAQITGWWCGAIPKPYRCSWTRRSPSPRPSPQGEGALFDRAGAFIKP